jgi:hypothetical protein
LNAEVISKFRYEQTWHELELVSASVARELEELIADDSLGLHRTQLLTLKSVLGVAADELRANLGGIRPEKLKVGEVYDLCRDYDEAIVWLQRLWKYLMEKFEQRGGRGGGRKSARLLNAADEVVWSCYHEVLDNSRGKYGPPPLTYIEPEYSPATIQSDEPMPYSLRLTSDLEFLDKCLESLPVPVLRLPPSCVNSPWWLIYVAHEVGHHVQHELDLVPHFRLGMTASAVACGFTPDDAAACWGAWGEEIFADMFSIMLMGQWAVRAMAEAEVGTPARMIRRKTKYPAPVIRLALMERAAARLRLDVSEVLQGLDLKSLAEGDATTRADYGVVESAVEFALGPLPGDLGTLATLCLFDKRTFGEEGAVEGWSLMLAQDAPLTLDERTMRRLETARHVACASFSAWVGLSRVGDPRRRTHLRGLIKARTIDMLLQSGPREVRAGGAPAGAAPADSGRRLAGLLLKARRGGGV